MTREDTVATAFIGLIILCIAGIVAVLVYGANVRTTEYVKGGYCEHKAPSGVYVQWSLPPRCGVSP